MISFNDQKKIQREIQQGITNYLQSEDAQKLLSGKESGHTMSGIIEKKCADVLKEKGYKIEFERNKRGEILKRAHSDFLLQLDGDSKWYKINVKFGSEKPGQPNVCSMNRILDGLKEGLINSYYILKVKYDKEKNTTKVYFVDILDYIDCITYDAGTGQIMLKEKKFYEIYSENNIKNNDTLEQKYSKLTKLALVQMQKKIKKLRDNMEKIKNSELNCIL